MTADFQGAASPPVRESQATKLLDLAWSGGVEYFHDPEGRPYATFQINSHWETHSLRSRGFRIFHQQRYYSEKGSALTNKSFQGALGVLEGAAINNGPVHEVYCRVGEHAGAVYVDLGNEKWEAVKVTAGAWEVVPRSPCRFRRARGLMPMAYPKHDPRASTHLREIFNTRPDSNYLELLLAWSIGCFRPKGPFPVLVVNSERGSAKTTLLKVRRRLIDPNRAPARSLPREERDLVIGAANCWIISLDNVSHLPDWLSDAICRLSTGGSFATRQRHTDEDEILFNVQRPCLVNGIEEIAVRGDLVDRAIVLELPSIPEDKRITDEEFWARFDEWEPGLFGYLLDAVAGALPRYESVKLTRLPRMADFAKWITAAEPALGWEDHFFVGAYTENRKQANDVTIEASPIARHVVALAATGSWEGTATALLERLNVKATDAERRSKTWPQASNGLSNALRRLAPSLRSKGVNVQFHRDQNVRTILVSSQSETSVAHDDLHDDVCSNDDPMTIFGAPDRLQ